MHKPAAEIFKDLKTLGLISNDLSIASKFSFPGGLLFLAELKTNLLGDFDTCTGVLGFTVSAAFLLGDSRCHGEIFSKLEEGAATVLVIVFNGDVSFRGVLSFSGGPNTFLIN